jgi:hypothetical protein
MGLGMVCAGGEVPGEFAATEKVKSRGIIEI